MAQPAATRRISVHPVLGEDTRRDVVDISVDGRRLRAFAGESIAAALLAHGVAINRTMPDTNARRGYFCGTGRCPDCSMTVDGELNVRACVTPVHDGMVIETQQGLGSWKVGD
jgi:predicted molibdopterin-dependent oxidoreductase YjgC